MFTELESCVKPDIPASNGQLNENENLKYAYCRPTQLHLQSRNLQMTNLTIAKIDLSFPTNCCEKGIETFLPAAHINNMVMVKVNKSNMPVTQ